MQCGSMVETNARFTAKVQKKTPNADTGQHSESKSHEQVALEAKAAQEDMARAVCGGGREEAAGKGSERQGATWAPNPRRLPQEA